MRQRIPQAALPIERINLLPRSRTPPPQGIKATEHTWMRGIAEIAMIATNATSPATVTIDTIKVIATAHRTASTVVSAMNVIRTFHCQSVAPAPLRKGTENAILPTEESRGGAESVPVV